MKVCGRTFSAVWRRCFAKVQPFPVVATAQNDTALVRITGHDEGIILARTGVPFDNSLIKQLQVLQAAVRSPGQGRWQSAAGILVKLTLNDRRTVLTRVDTAGVQSPLLQTGADDPHFPARLSSIGVPNIGGIGVAVVAKKTPGSGRNASNDTALLVAADGNAFTEAVAEDSDAGLPGGAKFATLYDPVANDQGSVLFYGTLRGGAGAAANAAGLWQVDDGHRELVARIGALATDENGVQLPDRTWGAITSFALPDGVAAGPVFAGQLAGRGLKASEKSGLWAVDTTGLTRLVLRAGWQVTVPTGEKTVASFSVLNALPGSVGARRSYNASGSLAVQVTFTDKTQAILRLDVP
jgi:hypothetical protein